MDPYRYLLARDCVGGPVGNGTLGRSEETITSRRNPNQAACYSVAMLGGYLPIFIFLAIAIAFPIVTIVAAKLIRPSSPFATKLEAYECGIKAASNSRGRY